MGVHSGKHGVINGRSSVRNWSITDSMNNPVIRASNTKSGTARRNGTESWNGSFQQYGGVPALLPGNLFTFQGYTAPDDDTLGGDGLTYSGQGMVGQLVVNWDWRGGQVINHTTNFDGHLALTIGEGVYSDNSALDAPEICGAKIEHSVDGTTWLELENVATATLTITAAIQSYVNSSTGCWTGRKASGIDWTLAITLDDNARDVLVKGSDYQLRLYVDPTDFWLLKWGKVNEYTGITVDTDSGAIIGSTVNLGMNGHVGGVIGQITLPGAVTNYWPETITP